MKTLNIIGAILFAVIFCTVFGAFFDVITAKEAIMVLAVLGLPLTALSKLSN